MRLSKARHDRFHLVVLTALVSILGIAADVPVSAQQPRLLKGHVSGVFCVAFSPDGKTLASGGRDRTIRLWDVASGEALRTIVTHSSHPTQMDRIVTQDTSQIAREMPAVTQRAGRPFEPDADDGVGEMLGKALMRAATEYAKARAIEHVKAKAEADQAAGYVGAVQSLAYSPDGKVLAAAIHALFDPKVGPQVKLYDAQTGEILAEMDASEVPPANFGVTAGDFPFPYVAGGGGGGPTSTCRSVAFSPDGRFVATGNARGEIRLWTAQGELASTFGGQYRYREGFSRGKYHYVGRHTGISVLALFPCTTSATDRTSPDAETFPSASQPRRTSYDRTGSSCLVAAADANGTVRLWDLQGRLLRAWQGTRGMRGWPRELPRPDAKKEFFGLPPITCLACSGSGDMLAWGRTDGKVCLWDVRTGREGKQLDACNTGVHSLAFSPDGTTLATAGVSERRIRLDRHFDLEIKLWDLPSGKHKATLRRGISADWALCVAFSPDGRTLASGCWHGPVALWDVNKALSAAKPEPNPQPKRPF